MSVGTDGGPGNEWRRRVTNPDSARECNHQTARGQANLPVVAVALVVLTAVTGMTVAMAEGAHLSAERDVEERAAAVSTAEAFVDGDADHVRRDNVLDAAALANAASDGDAMAVAVRDDASVRIRADEEVVFERGEPEGGTTVRRLALVATDEPWNGTVSTAAADELDLPAETTTVEIVSEGAVETVWMDDRVVGHDGHGSDEPARIEVPPDRTRTVSADGAHGRVHVTAHRERTERVVVEVTVDG